MSNFFTNGKGPSVFFLMTNPDDIYGNMIGKPHSKFSYRFFGGGKNREKREREGEGEREGLNWCQCFVSLGGTGTRV